jgi:hypothetical protein
LDHRAVTASSNKARLPAWLRWTVVVIGAVALFALVLRLVLPTPAEEYDQLLDELRAEGYALRIADLAGPEPPESDNGASLLDAAVARMTEIVGDPGKALDPLLAEGEAAAESGRARDEASLARAREFLDRIAPALREIEAAADRRIVRWPPNDAVDAPTPWTPTLQRVNRTLEIRLECARTPEERLSAARVMLAIGRKVEPMDVLTAMVASATRGGAVDDLRRQVERGDLPAALARSALDAELRAGTRLSLDRTARLEIAFWAPVLRAVSRGEKVTFGGGSTSYGAELGPEMRSPFARLWLGTPCDALRDLRAVSRVAETSHAARRRELRGIETKASKLSRTFVLPFPIVEKKAAETDARLRLARIALAATERREATGAWPASLDELRDAFVEGGVPLDPFTDRPFTYEVKGRALRISSAGRCDDEPAVAEADLVEDGLVWTIER